MESTEIHTETHSSHVYSREGVFYAVFNHPCSEENLEIALHGISNHEEALVALKQLTSRAIA